MGLPVCLLFSFAAIAPEVDVAWRTSVAQRIWDLPNPYGLPGPRPAVSPLAPEPPPLPEPAGERRWFATDDSGDMMGLSLGRNVVVGLQVEFVGPGEIPQKTTRVLIDPYDPKFLLTTAGLRVGF